MNDNITLRPVDSEMLSLNEGIIVALIAQGGIDETNVIGQMRAARRRIANLCELVGNDPSAIEWDAPRDENDVDEILQLAGL